MKNNIFATSVGIVLVGAVIGVLAIVLQKMGNPANMGICVACFERDISGALGLHRAAVVQYLRPEILGFVLGSLLAAMAFREFKPRGGSSPVIRFVLGMVAAIGALVFLGCPWRAILRMATYEMVFSPDRAPIPAIIDEAIELAKKYSTENSGKFINGLLDQLKNERK